MSNRKQKMENRLNLFINTIKQDRKKQENKIKQLAEIQQADARKKIMDAHIQSQKQNHIKRIKSLEVEARIYKSSKINGARMQKMNVRHELIQKIRSDLIQGLKKITNDKGLYEKLLKKLIIQGLIKLMEVDVQIKCLKRDLQTVKKIIKQAQAQFNKISAELTTLKIVTKIVINQNQFLDNQYKDLIGGIVLSSLKGRIVCINTLDARLNYCLQQMLPVIRNNLFDGGNKSQ